MRATQFFFPGWFSSIAGTIAALGAIARVGMLAYRRPRTARVRATTSPVDWAALILLPS